ncbi:GNAT family N-acetyltransferase [Paenibacillus glacialis]|uniref:GCN5 family acetyltransferase n=1 Tax=Paenibacillus glacialis TaxID=494026 RepID=A0A168KSV3_9BACL|nr:GNAT family protein [Paenibacillus glacialis]OAB42420.1 GCN5 family acetyltransferase [Paenibacillus glacialis]
MKEQCKGSQMEGSTINLRIARESDVQLYYSYLLEPEGNRLTGTHGDFTLDGTATWIKKISIPNEDRVDFMIVSKDTDEFMGEVVLNEMDSMNRSANIRIGIGKQHVGKGYGTEAIKLMLRYGFETLNLHRIELGVYTFNPRAIHVYEKIGFQRVGILRDTLYYDEEFHDLIMMSILENEFQWKCE